HLSSYQDETSDLCHWHVLETHTLETWGDARGYDGTVTIMQPLIAPLYDGKSAYEVLALLSENPDLTAHDAVKEYWKKQSNAADFDSFWRKSLHDGIIAGSALPEKQVSLGTPPEIKITDPTLGGTHVIFRPDPTIHDGRFANNAWLQEIPKPLTKITWDNAAYLSPKLAEKLHVQNQDLVDLTLGNSKVMAPVWIMPGQVDNVVTLHLGYGRTRAGKVGNGTGFNAFQIRNSKNLWDSPGLEITRAHDTYELSVTQEHQVMENRNLV